MRKNTQTKEETLEDSRYIRNSNLESHRTMFWRFMPINQKRLDLLNIPICIIFISLLERAWLAVWDYQQSPSAPLFVSLTNGLSCYSPAPTKQNIPFTLFQFCIITLLRGLNGNQYFLVECAMRVQIVSKYEMVSIYEIVSMYEMVLMINELGAVSNGY